MSTKQRRRSSVLSDDQQDFLERRLANRPSQTEIQHVRPSNNVDFSLQGTMRQLENQITRNSVSHLLEGRPEPEDLVKAGIAKPMKQAGRIQGMAARLERRMSRDFVGHALEKRPEIMELQSRDILKDQRTAPVLQSKQKELQQNLARSNLYHALKYRPSVDQLVEKGLYPEEYLDYSDSGGDYDDYKEDYGDEDVMREKLATVRATMSQADWDEFCSDYSDWCTRCYEQYGEYPDALEFYEMWEARDDEEEGYDEEQYQQEQYEHEEEQYKQEQYQQEYEQVAADHDDNYDGGEYYEDPEGEYYDDEKAGEYFEEPEEDQYYYDDEGNVYYDDDEEEQDYQEYEEEQPSSYQRRSKNFHLTRILLKFVASMAEAGEITLEQKGWLKDLIVDQDTTILAVAETFDAENDLNDFKDSLIRLASRTR